MARVAKWALACLMFCAPAWAQVPAQDVRGALAIGVGEHIDMAGLPLSMTERGKIRMERIEVYAADARIFEAHADGLRELPRSNWLHFRSDRGQPGAPRLALSLSPDGSHAHGILLPSNGHALAIRGDREGD